MGRTASEGDGGNFVIEIISDKISCYEINFYYLLSLPDGIYVRAFEDRMDLYSVMIKGPQNTPYEGIYRFIFMHCQTNRVI